jgi:D-galactarolactone cycloisomerase
VRNAIGQGVDLMISDFAPPRPVSKAIRMARALEEYNLVFWEEPITRGDIEGYVALTEAVDLPIAAGEEMSNQMLKYFISKRAVDIINPDVAQIGGLSEMKRIVDLAHMAKIPLHPYHF